MALEAFIYERVLEFGIFLESILSIPTRVFPEIQLSFTMVAVSAFLGYFFSRSSPFGVKWIFSILLSIMAYGTLRFLGVG